MIADPTPMIGFMKDTIGTRITLINVAIRKELIPPIRDFIAFIPTQSGPANGGNGAKIARIRFLSPLIRFDLLELKSIY